MILKTKFISISLDNAILPLINIVFLVLIFFLVVGKFHTSQQDTIQTSKLYVLQDYNATEKIVRINEMGKMIYKGKPLRIRDVRSFRNKNITMSVDKYSNARTFLKALEYLKKSGAKNIRVVVGLDKAL